MNHNWRISAVLKTPDIEVKKVATNEEATTYNFYLNGTTIATNVQDTEYLIVNAKNGKYTVTANVKGEESGESNAITYTGATSGISNLTPDADVSNADVYSVDGKLIGKANQMNELRNGVYIINGKNTVK